jgi:hypothetical protein
MATKESLHLHGSVTTLHVAPSVTGTWADRVSHRNALKVATATSILLTYRIKG